MTKKKKEFIDTEETFKQGVGGGILGAFVGVPGVGMGLGMLHANRNRLRQWTKNMDYNMSNKTSNKSNFNKSNPINTNFTNVNFGGDIMPRNKPKKDSSGKGRRANRGRGGCSTTRSKGQGRNR